jgi:hypothetical protein
MAKLPPTYYPPLTNLTGKAEPFQKLDTIPFCPIRRDVDNYYMFTTLSGVNKSNAPQLLSSGELDGKSKQALIQTSKNLMMQLYWNLRRVTCYVEYVINDNATSSWAYVARRGFLAPPIEGILDGEARTETEAREYLLDPEEGQFVIIDELYATDGSGSKILREFTYNIPPEERGPCPPTSVSVTEGPRVFDPYAVLRPIGFESLYYDDVFIGYAARRIISWDSGLFELSAGRFTGTSAYVYLGGSIISDSTLTRGEGNPRLERKLAYVKFPNTVDGYPGPWMICEATAQGLDEAIPDPENLTAYASFGETEAYAELRNVNLWKYPEPDFTESEI